MSVTHVYLVMGSLLGLMLLAEIISGAYSNAGARAELGPNILCAVTYFLLRSAHFAVIFALCAFFLPAWSGALAGLPVLPTALCALLVTDYLQYWMHRLCHTWPWLWRLHKPHHALAHLNTFATFSGNCVYTFIIPSNTTAPLLIFLGAPQAALYMSAAITFCAFNEHNALRWDLFLRRWTPTRFLMDIVERVFTLQDFHHAHHGLGRLGRSSGNFAGTLTLFDWLHGTGHQPHAMQEKFGLPAGVSVEPWYVRVWWPILRTKERADLRVPTEETVRYSSIELATAAAVIITADDRAVPVSLA